MRLDENRPLSAFLLFLVIRQTPFQGKDNPKRLSKITLGRPNFVIEAVLDFEDSLAKAGGVLIYQDDNTLLRFACGALFDGEISFAVKSPELGFYAPGRGLLEKKRLALRVERRGKVFGA